jgi:hypothetical protein
LDLSFAFSAFPGATVLPRPQGTDRLVKTANSKSPDGQCGMLQQSGQARQGGAGFDQKGLRRFLLGDGIGVLGRGRRKDSNQRQGRVC